MQTEPQAPKLPPSPQGLLARAKALKGKGGKVKEVAQLATGQGKAVWGLIHDAGFSVQEAFEYITRNGYGGTFPVKNLSESSTSDHLWSVWDRLYYGGYSIAEMKEVGFTNAQEKDLIERGLHRRIEETRRFIKKNLS